jgi:protein-tyrosine phosphatase
VAARDSDAPRAPSHCDIRNDLRAERVMVEIYRRFPAYMGGTLATLADRLLAGGAPLLVHCSAGKDRTGFIVAMLLHALEVPEELIRQDYLASRTWPGADSHRASLEARLGAIIPPHELPSAVDTVLDVRDVYLDAAMEALRAEFGSVLRYLETAASLDARRIDRLRNDLLG